MRHMSRFIAAAAVSVLVTTGCAREEGGSGGDTTDGEDTSGILDCDAADGDGPKVGVAYDVGGQGDKSFNDAAAVGVAKAVEDLGATCAESEAQDQEPESAREDRLRQLAEGGYSPVIGVGFAYSESINAVAPDFPEVSFAVVDGFDPDDEPNDNVAYLGFAENEGSFLVGVAAAETTQADHVGFVGGVNNDLIKKFEAGYVAGVEAVNPDITVDITYIEQTDLAGFADPAGGKAAATGMYDAGADVVYHAAGGSGAGVFSAAVESGEGSWAIGVDSDQYLTASPEEQEHILTSMLKRVDVAAFDMIESVDQEEPLVSYQVYDLSQDGVGYATSGGHIDDITETIDGYAEQIRSGKIKVPTAPAG